MPAAILDTLLRLPRKRRMEIAERLWFSVADERSDPMPAGHRQIVGARLADYRAGKARPIPHADLMRRLRAKRTPGRSRRSTSLRPVRGGGAAVKPLVPGLWSPGHFK